MVSSLLTLQKYLPLLYSVYFSHDERNDVFFVYWAMCYSVRCLVGEGTTLETLCKGRNLSATS